MEIDGFMGKLPRGSSIYKSDNYRQSNKHSWKYEVSVPNIKGAENSFDRHKSFKGNTLKPLLRKALVFKEIISIVKPPLYILRKRIRVYRRQP